MIAFYAPSIISFGSGSIAIVGTEVQRLGGKHVFLITSCGMPERSIFTMLNAHLADAGIRVTHWARVPAEPGVADLAAALEECVKELPDIIVGLGGGSAMDIAKLVAILLTNAGPVEHFFGINKVPKPGLPTIMIPTTAGSGSEVSQEAVLTDHRAGTKFAVKDRKLVPTCAIIDPQATMSNSPTLTAVSGLDALTHALEAFTSLRANPITDMYALQAVKLIWEHLPQAVTVGSDATARLGMALGALLAGQAFTGTGTAAVHACGYPLSGFYKIPHGAANALMLPHVLAFNAETCLKYEQFYPIFATRDIPKALTDLVQFVGLPTRLRDAGVERETIPKMAAIAAQDERHLSVNPRALTVSDLEEIFERAW